MLDLQRYDVNYYHSDERENDYLEWRRSEAVGLHQMTQIILVMRQT